eukprot:CAMPEP_0203746122 /NCGR_PEP_ID=MMETSP0098-20131031/1653_1 /ASSEMBLY_ACC=CAM_ASM_000208 /TAXON_ID=96639 /ORGANISM=" , Strain NY0313808BC1" /LENGTH=333 /DNA_ID=CAMNT_0050634097 /DNA_START=51 /DNA_END=1052 /DNA_ORIENTATION=-
MNVEDLSKDWQPAITLTYPDFLEAIGRVTELVIIPTKHDFEKFGVDNIVQFYSLMERTNLWSSVGLSAQDNETRLQVWRREEGWDDLGTVPIDPRTLGEKVELFMELISCRKQREKQREMETEFWKNRAKKKPIDVCTEHCESKFVYEILEAAGKLEEEEELDIDKVEEVEDDLETFEVSTASELHEMWRSKRKMMEDGTFEPRIKIIKSQKYDIANLTFKELPPYFKLENLLASHAACESIRRCWQRMGFTEDDLPHDRKEKFASELNTAEFLELASEDQHINWLKRNGEQPWVSIEQKLPYAQLSEEEKQKDRDIVLASIKVYLEHLDNIT